MTTIPPQLAGILTLLLALCASPLLAIDAGSSTPPREVRAEVKPVSNWFRSVQTSDLALFRSVWSETMLTRMPALDDEEKWKEALRKYATAWERAFGAYQLSDFSFTYAGDGEKGVVTIDFRSTRLPESPRKLPGIRVVKEPAGWRIDER